MTPTPKVTEPALDGQVARATFRDFVQKQVQQAFALSSSTCWRKKSASLSVPTAMSAAQAVVISGPAIARARLAPAPASSTTCLCLARVAASTPSSSRTPNAVCPRSTASGALCSSAGSASSRSAQSSSNAPHRSLARDGLAGVPFACGEFAAWQKRQLPRRYVYAFADGTSFSVISDGAGQKMPIWP
jgi:hypothetical protein